jgi:hypothetical protein
MNTSTGLLLGAKCEYGTKISMIDSGEIRIPVTAHHRYRNRIDPSVARYATKKKPKNAISIQG